ncbi:hypothetical protein JZ751_012810 [Albula glossodonta]|uniref:Uncharacterized protein n=1 Tax=Albula glossodonta TaxID=121402 RepID=A0A8T2MM39_9TELE|nr:hypothetical protein JZ751_012810 [Albula glossodonta]
MGELAQPDGVDHRAMAVFSGPGVQAGPMGDLLNGRIPSENFSSLELDDNLLHSTSAGAHLPPPPPPPAPPAPPVTTATSSSPAPALLPEPAFSRTHPSHLLAKPEAPHASSPHGSHYSGEHVPSPYSDHISSPHAASFQTDSPLLLEVPLSGVPGGPSPRSPWSSLPLPMTDPAQFGTLMGPPDSHLLSTSLSTPPATSTSHSLSLQPAAALSALPHGALTGLTVSPSAAPTTTSSSSPATCAHELLSGSGQPKQQLPQFSAAFGHQLSSHSGIPKDKQPSHSSTAPPTGFSIASATAAASANSAMPPSRLSDPPPPPRRSSACERHNRSDGPNSQGPHAWNTAEKPHPASRAVSVRSARPAVVKGHLIRHRSGPVSQRDSAWCGSVRGSLWGGVEGVQGGGRQKGSDRKTVERILRKGEISLHHKDRISATAFSDEASLYLSFVFFFVVFFFSPFSFSPAHVCLSRLCHLVLLRFTFTSLFVSAACCVRFPLTVETHDSVTLGVSDWPILTPTVGCCLWGRSCTSPPPPPDQLTPSPTLACAKAASDPQSVLGDTPSVRHAGCYKRAA